jgi:hypothetical protein
VARVALCEAEDVAGVGVPPAVDQLVVIAAHAQVPVGAGEQVGGAVGERPGLPGARAGEQQQRAGAMSDGLGLLGR